MVFKSFRDNFKQVITDSADVTPDRVPRGAEPLRGQDVEISWYYRSIFILWHYGTVATAYVRLVSVGYYKYST